MMLGKESLVNWLATFRILLIECMAQSFDNVVCGIRLEITMLAGIHNLFAIDVNKNRS